MRKRQIRQRVTPTYLQTYFFDSTPQPQAIATCNRNCGINFIDHPIQNCETKEQKEHKNLLGIQSQNTGQQFRFAQYMGSSVSRKAKKKDLKGQLEEAGTYFFLRSVPDHEQVSDQLIPSDCRFNHTCYGRRGWMNQYCRYKGNLDSTLKQQYDFKHANCGGEKLYTFGLKKKGK